jgi:hypothetical protein
MQIPTVSSDQHNPFAACCFVVLMLHKLLERPCLPNSSASDLLMQSFLGGGGDLLAVAHTNATLTVRWLATGTTTLGNDKGKQ